MTSTLRGRASGTILCPMEMPGRQLLVTHLPNPPTLPCKWVGEVNHLVDYDSKCSDVHVWRITYFEYLERSHSKSRNCDIRASPSLKLLVGNSGSPAGTKWRSRRIRGGDRCATSRRRSSLHRPYMRWTPCGGKCGRYCRQPRTKKVRRFPRKEEELRKTQRTIDDYSLQKQSRSSPIPPSLSETNR